MRNTSKIHFFCNKERTDAKVVAIGEPIGKIVTIEKPIGKDVVKDRPIILEFCTKFWQLNLY